MASDLTVSLKRAASVLSTVTSAVTSFPVYGNGLLLAAFALIGCGRFEWAIVAALAACLAGRK